jgi:hypothetical protein
LNDHFRGQVLDQLDDIESKTFRSVFQFFFVHSQPDGQFRRMLSFFPDFSNGKSKIANRQSAIANRKSKIAQGL